MAETRVLPITNLEEDQCQEGGSHKVLVVGDGGGGRELINLSLRDQERS